jgi:hypothetical protein
MKKIIKRFWGVGLIVIILSSLFMVAPVSAADPMRWEMKTGGPSGQFNAVSFGTTVYDYAIAPNGATMYAACGPKFFQSTNGGSTWTDIYSRLPTASGNVTYVALAPDDPNIVVTVSINLALGTNNVAISVNGGVTFTNMALTTSATQVIKGLDVSALVTGGFRYVSVFGSDAATTGSSVLYYFNYGAGVGGWRNAVTQFTTLPANSGNIDNIVALAFSPNFASDYMAVALSEQKGNTTLSIPGTLRLHVLSFNSFGWDTVVSAGYPVAVATETATSNITVNKASVALGPDYMGGDETLRVAFVGADITSTGVLVTSGIWRCNDTAAARKVYDGAGINSLAFDGTNLVAGAFATNNVLRSSDPLASSPTFTGARSFKRIGVDDAGNDQVEVMYVGDNVFGSKRGVGGAMSKSVDDGNTWNDFTLINMNLSNYDDILVSADGATWYAAVRDTNLSAVFRISPMQRVLCVAVTGTDPDFMLRGLSTDANVIYAADKGGTTIYYSADGGVSRWQQRLNVPAAISDLAVEGQNVIYFGSSVNVYKSINNGFTWNLPVNTTISGGIYTLVSLGENKLVAGGTTGGVIWSKDGATTWSKSMMGVSGGANLRVAATGLETGNFIFASGGSNAVYRCEIAPSNPMGEFKDMNLAAATATETTTGLMFTSGVLYAVSATTTTNTTYLNSTLYPAVAGTHTANLWRTRFSSAAYNPTGLLLAQTPTALKVSTSSTGNTTSKITLWAINTLSLGFGTGTPGVRYFDDTLATTGPAMTSPADKALVQTNSVTGNPMNVNLMWTRLSMATGYDIQVAMDSSFNSLLSSITRYGTPFCNVVTLVGVDGTSATMSLVYAGNAALFNPGSTYYWRIRASDPISSAWSETRTFTMQPVAAAVPAISSPANGSTITSQNPAFSWSPVTGATKYEFQLSTMPSFDTTVLTDKPASAGSVVPVTIKLDQGKQYFWRVRALEPVQGDWSTAANFLVATPAAPPAPPVTITNVPAPIITIPAAPSVPAITLAPAAVEQIAPSYIWAIIIIGGILVIAVIVLIVRTRRSV